MPVRQTRFEKDAPVWITRLGPSYGDQKFRAEVVGVAVDETAYPAHYIVRLIDKIDPDHPFDYIMITGACLDERGNL
jgi:hypothetical protein